MLAFLEALCTALVQRDKDALQRLLQHPLAGALPSVVVEEARKALSGALPGTHAPIHALRLYHQTAHLLSTTAARRAHEKGESGESVVDEGGRQIELPLPARVA